VNDRSAEEYLITGNQGGGWRWDAGRWGSGGKVGDVVGALTQVRGIVASDVWRTANEQEINSIESTQKQKQQSYGLAKGSLSQLQRKKL